MESRNVKTFFFKIVCFILCDFYYKKKHLKDIVLT